MRNNILLWICISVVLVILAIVYVDRNSYVKNWMDNIHKSDTVYATRIDTIWNDTTIIVKEFIPKYITKTKVDTIYTKEGDTLQLVTESKMFEKTLVIDKDTADVQIYTQGINTSLDSLKMALKTHSEVITNTVEVTKYVEREKRLIDRFHIQPQVGLGYGIINNKFDVYVGIGVGFDITK